MAKSSVPLEQRVLYTLKEVGQLTGLARSTIYLCVQNGALKTIRKGRCRRVTRAELLRFSRTDTRIPATEGKSAAA